jgi:hypothetical protein
MTHFTQLEQLNRFILIVRIWLFDGCNLLMQLEQGGEGATLDSRLRDDQIVN